MDVLIALVSLMAIIFAIFLLVFGLFSAPWQILLLLLAAGLFGTRWLVEQDHSTAASEATEAASATDQPMEQTEQPTPQPFQKLPLSYRGATYKPIPPTAAIAEIGNAEITGKYRGGIWKKSSDMAKPSPEAEKDTRSGKYRGCTWKSPN